MDGSINIIGIWLGPSYLGWIGRDTSADNAVVMAVMVKHLPKEQQRKALFYGLMGAFVFRFASLFLISFLVDVWQVQAIGAIYLLFIAFQNIYKKYAGKGEKEITKPKKQSGFWMTVVKVEAADIAFAIDSMLVRRRTGCYTSCNRLDESRRH